MKKLKQLFSLVILITLTTFISSCNQDATPSLYQPSSPGPTPVIASLIPANQGLAGVTQITINGSNFSSVPAENMVYFGTAQATVLQASPTQLIVQAPNLIQDSLAAKIAVKGVVNFSNVVKYNLRQAVGIYYPFTLGIDNPMSVAVDNAENLYLSMQDNGIKQISSKGILTTFAPKGSESFFFDMKMGPGNTLYCTRNLRAIFTVTAGQASTTFVTFPTGTSIIALDFDKNQNIWASGGGGNIFCITLSKVITTFPITTTVSALRVYNGYLYVAGKSDTEEAIYRYPITGTSIGAQEKVFDIGAKYGLNVVQVGGIAFSAAGDMLIGTSLSDAVIKVSGGAASSLYTGLISPYARSMGWGTANNLFLVREYSVTSSAGAVSIYHTIVRVDMQTSSAPYYGR